MRNVDPNDPLVALLTARGFSIRALAPLSGDLSTRRYLRAQIEPEGTAVLALYPETLRGDCARFSISTRWLSELAVRVPGVLAADCSAGWMLVEDLGQRTLGDSRDLAAADLAAYFRRAVEIAERIRSLPREAVAELNPPLDAALLRREIEQTRTVYLEPRGLLKGAFGEKLATALDGLCAELAHPPLVPCHRDFMVRNLMPAGPPPGLAVLDHQGLRLGPPRYDLASLLNDTLFPPAPLELRLLDELLRGEADRRAYHRAAAQRTLKAIGSYAAAARRGIDRHLPLIGPTFERALAHLSKAPETASLAPELERRWRQAGEHPVLR
jgi:aminoglycoside/choline kinase family phosphotransferase